MKTAIMQPYIFPYIGYLQLINAVDKFVFYDDVNFVKKGWINRNNILIDKKASLFTIPVLKASQNKLINEINVGFDEKWKTKFFKSIDYNYCDAPFYADIKSLLEHVFETNECTIAELGIKSIKNVCEYLKMDTEFEISSLSYSDSKGMEKSDRLINISKKTNADYYINAIGGVELYDKAYFKKSKVDLRFLNPSLVTYQQGKLKEFVPNLSIIDVLMYNSIETVQEFLEQYQLV